MCLFLLKVLRPGTVPRSCRSSRSSGRFSLSLGCWDFGSLLSAFKKNAIFMKRVLVLLLFLLPKTHLSASIMQTFKSLLYVFLQQLFMPFLLKINISSQLWRWLLQHWAGFTVQRERKPWVGNAVCIGNQHTHSFTIYRKCFSWVFRNIESTYLPRQLFIWELCYA